MKVTIEYEGDCYRAYYWEGAYDDGYDKSAYGPEPEVALANLLLLYGNKWGIDE